MAMAAVVILTGSSVALAGKIAFVGLVVPHITRFLVGSDYSRLIPCACIIGGVFLTLCDLASRFINYPFETPIEVVTSIIGVPFFLYLIKRKGGISVVRKMAGIYIILIALILFVSYFSMTSGSFSAKPGELLSTLFRIHPNPQYDILLFQLRLPRIVMAAAIGLGLGIAGAVIQAITKNGLADPGILGINAGAGAGIVAFMLLFQGQSEATALASAMGMPVFGLIGGLMAAVLIYIFAWHRGIWNRAELFSSGSP